MGSCAKRMTIQFYRLAGGGARAFAGESAGAAAALGRTNAMQVVERSALVTYTAAQMFVLVNDVARYPEFLPWCVGARVEEVSADERIAALKVARGVLQTEFTTRNTLQQDAQIHMQLMHGPFRNLVGEWRFEPIGTRGPRVHFRIEFEFKNRLSASAFNAVFGSLCGTIFEAFVLRAPTGYPG